MADPKAEDSSGSSDAAKQEKPKRLWRNYLLNPQFQLKFSVYFIVSVLAVVGVMVALIFTRLQDVREIILQYYGEDTILQSHLDQTIFEITLISFSILIGFSAISFFYSLIITHRIAGPTLVICRFIEDLKKGDYEGNRRLRQYDELKPIMQGLNELASVLKSKES
ncbi:MAG: hypothetical protein H6624_13150 [Bdellovibrionaceae bacterium]|nr:hypothetical protein [Bdellovibrionales bacterium]MCB9085289.1 hypothetical protein [Pseudobdellovibrionaceae bacterium]